MNANGFFDNRDGGGKQQILRQNQFGGDFGGPIKKNKIFIFGNYQETRQLNGVAARGRQLVFLSRPFRRATAPRRPGRLRLERPIVRRIIRDSAAFSQRLRSAARCRWPATAPTINPVSLAMLNLKLPNGQYYIPTNTGVPFQECRSLSSPAIYHEHQLITNMDYAGQQQEHLLGQVFLHS